MKLDQESMLDILAFAKHPVDARIGKSKTTADYLK
jgi:hypothetical protein